MCCSSLSVHYVMLMCFFFFKQKTAYEMRISDWSSDVCSSDLLAQHLIGRLHRMKALCRLGIVLVRVGMVDLGQSAIGQLHVAESGVDLKLQHFQRPHFIA